MSGRKSFFKDYYDTPKQETAPIKRFCEVPGCMRPGLFKAPKSRNKIGDHYWFCETHVKEYNSQWDYLEGMSPDDIEKEIRADTFWRRPAWKKNNLFKNNLFEGEADVFGLFQEHSASGPIPPSTPTIPENLSKAFSVMNLSFPTTREEAKKAYKHLVKKYHPDINGGSKEAEEKLKSINIAFQIIEDFLTNGKK